MASITFGGGISNMVGSAGGNTFAANKGGAYMKRRAVSVNPNSATQSIRRASLEYLSKNYSFIISDADRAAWRAFAAVNPVVNRLGNTTTLSGQQMFSKLNGLRTSLGFSAIAAPPASMAVTTPTSLLIGAASGGGGHINVTLGPVAFAANEYGILYVSPPMNPGRAFISSQLRLIQKQFNAGGPTTFTTEYTDIFGHLPPTAGQRVFVRFIIANLGPGTRSVALQGSTLWT